MGVGSLDISLIRVDFYIIYASRVPVFGIEFGVEALSVGCTLTHSLTLIGFTPESRILDGVLSLYFKLSEALFSLNGAHPCASLEFGFKFPDPARDRQLELRL
jgi:hypothetical protein